MIVQMMVVLAALSTEGRSLSGSVEFSQSSEPNSKCLDGPCAPGNDFCGQPFQNAPTFHLMDQHGCGENDPNGPVFDPVHGVIHHFYQIHLATGKGHGPDYGHFVSKDFISWAQLPVAIWNGVDSSVWPARATPYDNEAIFTGSATVVDGAGPGGKGKGIVNIYPGLCNKDDWPACSTGTLLAMAVPSDYERDELLTNWSKPEFNPIVESTQRDPSTAWKETGTGEWRLRTYDSMVYGAASDADFMAGRFYTIGKSHDFRTCECPSFYPLPSASPGTEASYAAHAASGRLPTHVHKTSCSGDWWQLGTYTGGGVKALGSFNATSGWEDLFAQRLIDAGHFYASKDNLYPSLDGRSRRINWGWATVPPASTQTLPREVTFNTEVRMLQQFPIEEINQLRRAAAYSGAPTLASGTPQSLNVPAGVAKASEVDLTISLEGLGQTTLSLSFGDVGSVPMRLNRSMVLTDLPGDDYSVKHNASTDRDAATAACQKNCDADPKCKAWTYVVRGAPSGSGDCCLKSNVPCPHSKVDSCTSGVKTPSMPTGCGPKLTCTVEYAPPTNASAPYYELAVACGGSKDTLRLTLKEKELRLRAYLDVTFAEVFFQDGRVAITEVVALGDAAQVALESDGADATVKSATVYPMKGIWTTPDAVRKAPRVYK
jgi:sucrose-6-phosphate hydrolase SacC (GH32 family)